MALRAGPVQDPALISRTLVKNTRLAVASPTYLARRGVPSSPEELVDHDCIVGYRAGLAPEADEPAREVLDADRLAADREGDLGRRVVEGSGSGEEEEGGGEGVHGRRCADQIRVGISTGNTMFDAC